MRIVVVGAGAAGVAAASWLHDGGHDVAVVEQDPWVPPDDPTRAVADWQRRGIPQGPHPHNFMAAARNLLAQRSPGALGDLLDAGAVEVPIGANLPDDPAVAAERRAELTALATRRQLFDWALFRDVARRGRIELRLGERVSGVTCEAGDPPRVSGVVVGGSTLHADLVIDAAGRRSPLRSAIQDAGVAPAVVGDEECGIFYLSQYHQLRPGEEAGPLLFDFAIRGELPYCRAGLFRADNHTVGTIFGIDPRDGALRRAVGASNESYRAALQAIPGVSGWFDRERTEPISPVAPMGGLRNTYRRLVDEARGPMVSGYLLAGDSACTTNPMLGWGASLALLQVAAIADELDDGVTGADLVAAVDRRFEEVVRPRWEASAAEDAERLSRWRGTGRLVSGERVERARELRRLGPVVPFDAVVADRVMRRVNLLDGPDDLFGDPAVAARAAERCSSPPTVEGAAREELIEALTTR